MPLPHARGRPRPAPPPDPPPADLPCGVHGHECRVAGSPLPSGYVNARHVGSGAFGRVYAAEAADGRKVALKVVSKCVLGTSAAALKALKAEVSIQQRMSHPHVVGLREVVEDRQRMYLVLDYVDGVSLSEVLKKEGRLPEATARTYFAYVCRALWYCHSRHEPVLHRDVKPANVLLRADRSSALLCDFGLAERIPPAGGPAPLGMAGTPNFLPPELLADGAAAQTHPCPPAVDAYAVGVLLYMMLVGGAPFDAVDVGRTFRRIRAGRLVFPPGVQVSGKAKAVVRALLSRDPRARPGMQELLGGAFLMAVPEAVPASLWAEGRAVRHGLVEAPGARGRGRAASFLGDADGAGRGEKVPRTAAAAAVVAGRRPERRPERVEKSEGGDGCGWVRERRWTAERGDHRRAGGLRGEGSLGGGGRGVQMQRMERRRPISVSMARCVALLNNMLVVFNEGLRVAQAQLEADREMLTADGASAAAQRRFLGVAHRVSDADAPMMVSRWLDMSATHGFATLMSDGRVGCCFNDASIMFNWSAQRDVPDVAYSSAMDRGVAKRALVAGMSPRARSSMGAATHVGAQLTADARDAIAGGTVGGGGGGGGGDGDVGGAAVAQPRVRRHESSMTTAQATRAAFQSSSQFRSEMTEKAKLLCRFREMLEEGAWEVDSDDEDGEAGAGRDIGDAEIVEGAPENGSMRRSSRRDAGMPSASSCSISFLGEDGAAGDPGCTESLLKVSGLDQSKLVHVRGWQRYKSPRALAFRLSNDSIHVKIGLRKSNKYDRYEENFVLDGRTEMLYYRDVDGKGWACEVADVSDFCFSKRIHSRLAFCSRIVTRFVSQQ